MFIERRKVCSPGNKNPNLVVAWQACWVIHGHKPNAKMHNAYNKQHAYKWKNGFNYAAAAALLCCMYGWNVNFIEIETRRIERDREGMGNEKE